jgi:dihydroflavonol-4-reductase
MRAFVTGGTGFIGERVIERLRARGDDVVALVRSPGKAQRLGELGCELAEGDLSDADAIRRGMEGCDAVFHVAAIYKIGIPKTERETMYDANVRGTERVLDAAIGAGVPRVVYVSTVNVFGNTRGEVVDERYERPRDGWLSCYDETKFLSHEVAKDRIAKGAPIVIVQPGGVYGPGDHSDLGNVLDQLEKGRLVALPFGDLGINFVHVDDAADGILLAHDKGTIGESYVIGGQIGTMREFVEKAAEISERRPPRFGLPTAVLKAMAPLGPMVAKPLGLQPNLGETIKVSDGVTYWARDDKARRELGYAPRDLDTGLRATLSSRPG